MLRCQIVRTLVHLETRQKLFLYWCFFQFHSRGTGGRFKTLYIKIDKLLRPHRGFEKIRPDLALSEYPTWACSGKVELSYIWGYITKMAYRPKSLKPLSVLKYLIHCLRSNQITTIWPKMARSAL